MKFTFKIFNLFVHLNIYIILAILLVTPGFSRAAEEYRNIKLIGSYGTKDGNLYYPCGVAVDSMGNVYVTDWRNRKVTKFSQDGKFLLDFDTKSKVYMRLKGPAGIAIDSNDNIYVVDQYIAKVFKYDLQGKYIGSFGNYGTATGKFLNPRGVAIDTDNNIYVADHDNFRVQKFNNKGDYITEFKYMSVETKKYAKPRGVACDNQNNVYVTYSDANKIAVFSQDGKVISDFGDAGTAPGKIKGPRYIVCDNSGNLYMTDYDNHRVQKFTKEFKYMTSFGSNGKKADNFRNPEGIFVDPSGNVYVADALNDRISKWEPEDIIKHANWASLFEKKGMLDDAINEYNEILKIKPREPGALKALVDLHLKAGRKFQQAGDAVKARSHYAEVLKYDQLNEIALREVNDLAGGTREERDAKKQNVLLGVFVVLAVLISMIMTFKSA